MLGFTRPGCRAVQRMLWDYTNGRLSEEMMERVESHLPTCAACEREFKAFRQAQGLISAYAQQPVPRSDSGWETLREQILAEGHAPQRRTETRATGLQNGLLPGVLIAGSVASIVTMIGYRLFLMPGVAGVNPVQSASAARPMTAPFAPAPVSNPRNSTSVANADRAAALPDWTLLSTVFAASPPDATNSHKAIPAVRTENMDGEAATAPVKHGKRIARVPAGKAATKRHTGERSAVTLKTASSGATAAKKALTQGMRFVPYHPRPEEGVQEVADRSPHYLLDQITPVSREHVSDMPPRLSPAPGDDDTAY